MSEAGNWQFYGAKWGSYQVRQLCSVSGFISIRINQFGRKPMISSIGGIPCNLFAFLHEIAIPEARRMVPPVSGRYGHKRSPLRREYCEALALVLRTRFVPEWPEPGQ
jgi:hypothetical protein